MKHIKIKDIFKDEVCIGGKANGRFLSNELEIELARNSVTIDFAGIDLITQSFSDEFLGPIIEHKGSKIFDVLFFKNCSQEIQAILTSTARRFWVDRPAVSR